MREISEWWKETGGSEAKWLILGKGPTFQKRGEFDLSPYRTLSLNHAVREMPVEVASIIDMDVVEDCAEILDTNARYLLMPRHPHVYYSPTERRLEDFFAEIPILRKLSEEGRLIWYNLASTPFVEMVAGSSPIATGGMSAEVLVQLIGMMGGRFIRTLGVDGGMAYASTFRDLSNRTRLAAGAASFDVQFIGMSAAIRRFGIDCAPLTCESPVRIFIETDSTQRIPTKVLEHALMKHFAVTYAFTFLPPVSLSDAKSAPRSEANGLPLSVFSVPQRTGYRGRALHLEAAMLVVRNLREIWEQPFEGAKALYAPPLSHAPVSGPLLLDCARLDWDSEAIMQGVQAGRYDRAHLLRALLPNAGEAQPALPPDWNRRDRVAPGQTALIHFADPRRQPWRSRNHPAGNLWTTYFREAMADGFIGQRELAQEIEQGFLRPSLLYQLKVPRRLWPVFNRTMGAAIDRRKKGRS